MYSTVKQGIPKLEYQTRYGFIRISMMSQEQNHDEKPNQETQETYNNTMFPIGRSSKHTPTSDNPTQTTRPQRLKKDTR